MRPVVPATPPITEAALFSALRDACGRYSGRIVMQILPCGEVLGNESAQARENVWPLVKGSCKQLRANCAGNLHDEMVDMSSQFHCDSIGARGDVCR
jgi:hypothetical protein